MIFRKRRALHKMQSRLFPRRRDFSLHSPARKLKRNERKREDKREAARELEEMEKVRHE